ncbi:hypothetical protein PtA15_4A200 [Puccinia triticina]|uniref:Uncharacterized protein n=1 Tax=Puccinia triticina TaxID=208348 RepID=A0ABY7CH07_9BASI|nr:uncharacterized protein PtA15_4A200 [Puccinia triticina]WAQ83752.1 hypothetical protein PtA15_4A200 [Puccinia triticina]
MNLNGLRKGYWEVLDKQASVDSVSSHEETPKGLNQISNPEHRVLPSPKGKENKIGETGAADLKSDQNGDKTIKNTRKNKKKSKGSKSQVDDDWTFLEELDQERNAKTPPKKRLGGVELTDEKKGQGKGGSTSEEIKRMSEAERDEFINGPVSQALSKAFIPSMKNSEDHIYPGLPRPKSRRKPTTNEALEKQLEDWKSYVNMWKVLGLDLDLMDSISRHMKIDVKTDHLPLSVLGDYTYEVLRDVWHTPEARVQFLANFQWWMKDILSQDEFHRRIKTLVQQVSERTIVENWKLISKHLVEKNSLKKFQVERIQKFYNLANEFPKPSTVSQLQEENLT